MTPGRRPPFADMLPDIPRETVVPKLLHQTYPVKSLPPEIRQNIDKIRQMNPGWEYQLYDDDDIVRFISENYHPRVLDYYRRINPDYGAARADLFRYLLLYRRGGVYLDIKGSLTRPLDEALSLDDVYLLSHWRNRPGEEYEGWGMWPDIPAHLPGEFQQWYLVAPPGHPFLRAVLERVLHNIAGYNPWIHGTGRLGVLRVTGPIAYTLALLPHLDEQRHRIVDCERDLGFQYSIYRETSLRAHETLFRSHYSQLDDPVVRLGPIGYLKAASVLPGKALRYARRLLQRRLRRAPSENAAVK